MHQMCVESSGHLHISRSCNHIYYCRNDFLPLSIFSFKSQFSFHFVNNQTMQVYKLNLALVLKLQIKQSHGFLKFNYKHLIISFIIYISVCANELESLLDGSRLCPNQFLTSDSQILMPVHKKILYMVFRRNKIKCYRAGSCLQSMLRSLVMQ